jgi:quercetin dioxygenase-like cupin family protein
MPFIDTSEIPEREPLPGWSGRFFHSERMTFAYYDVTAGSTIHEHAHPNDEAWHVLEGRIEFTVGGETHVLGPGCVAIVPPATPHSVRALTAARAIVADHPRRRSVAGVPTD